MKNTLLREESPVHLSNLYHVISAIFCVVLVVSNIISAKLIELPWFTLSIPAGLVTYPLTFLLSNLVTEIFGKKKARFMVYTALAMNGLSFAIIQVALLLPSQTGEKAFQDVLGLSGLRIFASMTAYLGAQLVDIQLFAAIKHWTKDRFLWLRNNGSTWVSQLVDTAIIDLIFLYWGLGMEMAQVMPIMAISFGYKGIISVINTPLLYLSLWLIRIRKKREPIEGEDILQKQEAFHR